MNFECGGKESRQIHDVEMELNEFQVQRAIDNLPVFKLGEKLTENMIVEQKEDNEVM